MGPDEGDHIVVIALTDKEKGSHGGMTAFLLHRNTPGISIGKTECKFFFYGAAVSEVLFLCIAILQAFLFEYQFARCESKELLYQKWFLQTVLYLKALS